MDARQSLFDLVAVGNAPTTHSPRTMLLNGWASAEAETFFEFSGAGDQRANA